MTLSHLDRLEAEAIHIIRETAAQFAKPVLLYSIGKDSTTLLHLCAKAFHPGKPPFPLLHIDSTWEFRDALTFRDAPGDGAWLRVALHLAGPLDGAPGSFYLDLTRAAARAGVAVTRASLPTMHQIRFGGLEVAEVVLAEGEGARACLGFRLLAGEPDLRILGFACDRERQPEPRALACTLDGLQLLAPGFDEGLARFFAAAELASGREPRLDCTAGRSGQKMIRRP